MKNAIRFESEVNKACQGLHYRNGFVIIDVTNTGGRLIWMKS